MGFVPNEFKAEEKYNRLYFCQIDEEIVILMQSNWFYELVFIFENVDFCNKKKKMHPSKMSYDMFLWAKSGIVLLT